jgi:hypothetical protein
MHTLHLTTDEKARFDSLSESLREGWSVAEEALTFADTQHRRRLRFEMLRVDDPRLVHFLEKAQQVNTPEEFDALIKATDFTETSDGDFSELVFAIGPDGVTTLLGAAFDTVKTDEDVAYAAELSQVRHGLLESLQNFSR